jgi:hypothetical protein
MQGLLTLMAGRSIWGRRPNCIPPHTNRIIHDILENRRDIFEGLIVLKSRSTFYMQIKVASLKFIAQWGLEVEREKTVKHGSSCEEIFRSLPFPDPPTDLRH